MTEQTVFLAAIEIADEGERAAYLNEACAGDAALRGQVEALLAAHERSGEFLDLPACGHIGPCFLQPGDGIEANDANGEGEKNAAVRNDRHDTNLTATDKHNHEVDHYLDFLQPSARPDSLGRLGHYEVLNVLGRGGFGIVLKAFDEMLHRMVAIKVMAPQLASTSPARKRFLREARAAAAIRHDNVVAIYAVEEQPIPYLVMEYIAGETLQQKLDRVGPLDTLDVVSLGQQIVRGLAAAHALGLIHRDIKPSNILLETSVDRVKLTDFGLARAADDASLTQSGLIAGTPMYMAPEQALGETIDQRADLFSLGSVLYVMCSGRPPFRASTALAVLKRVAEDTPRPLREIIPEIPAWLVDIVAKLHAKKAKDRIQSAKDVADMLVRGCAEARAHDRLTSPDLRSPADVPSLSISRSEVVLRNRRDDIRRSGIRRWLLGLGTLALVFFLAWIGFNFEPNLLSTLSKQDSSKKGTLEFEVANQAHGKAYLYSKADRLNDDKLVTEVDLATTRRIELQAGDYRLEVKLDWASLLPDVSGWVYDNAVTIVPGKATKVRINMNWKP